MKAKDITDCSECPLYENDCKGGMTSNGCGEPIEPPCCGWNEEDEITESMYSCKPLSENEIAQMRYMQKSYDEELLKKEQDVALQERKHLEKIVFNLNPKGISSLRKSSFDDGNDWYCNHCNKWVHPWWSHSHNCITETTCPKCNNTLVYCCEFDE